MGRIYQIVKKVTAGGPAPAPTVGAANFLPRTTSALALRSALRGQLARLQPALSLARAPVFAVARQRPAVALANYTSGAARSLPRPALLLAQRATGQSAKAPTRPAVDVMQTRLRLAGRYGANAVVETAVGARTDWTNDQNSTGLAQVTTTANFAGNALGARGGQLELSYADFSNKSNLLIDSVNGVRLHFYVRVAGSLLNNADVQLAWSYDATVRLLETLTFDNDNLATPRSFDITNLIAGNWSRLDALKTYVRADAALAETWTADLNAVELEINGEHTALN